MMKKHNKYDIDYTSAPSSDLQTLLKKYSTKNILIIENVLANKAIYHDTFQDILDIFKHGYEIKEIRERPIRFKFHDDDREEIHTLQLRHFLSNLILWYGFMIADSADIMDASYIHDCTNSNLGKIMKYLDDYVLPAISDVDIYTQNKIVDEIAHNMTALSAAFLPLIGSGISVYSIRQAEKRNPEIGEIMYGKLDPNMQPAEIEAELSKRTDRLIELFCEDDQNDLTPLFKAGNLLSKGQFKEIAVMIGLKSDVNGNTIPHLIDKNILVDGLNSPSAYYLVGESGRKSLIMSKTKMGEPGAFSKKAIMNTTAAKLRDDYQICNSQRPITYTIENDLFLKMLDKRYYYDKHGHMHQVNYAFDKNLIGQTLRFRSPCTCTSKDGVCAACYGGMFDINKDLASAGAYAATKETEPLGQRILSSKHLQMTHSNPIKFSDDFNRDFELNSDEITIKADPMDDDLYIVLDNVMEEESEDSSAFYCSGFHVIAANSKVVFNISEENGAKLYLTEQMLTLWKRQKDKKKPINLEAFDDDSSVLFNVEIKNKELTRPIKNINKLLNTNDKVGCKTLDEVCQMMARMKLEAGIEYDFVHDEMMIRELLRKKSNDMERPDFTRNGDWNDYKILRLNDALFKNPSPTVSLSYGYLRKQLLSPEFYEKRETSHLDALFTEHLDEILPEDDK